MKDGEIMQGSALQLEIDRLKAEFKDADTGKLNVLDALIRQAARETLYLDRLNEQAELSGLVQTHPENAMIQRVLPVSGEIAKHSANLTSIMDKLLKHLAVERDDEDEGLDDYA